MRDTSRHILLRLSAAVACAFFLAAAARHPGGVAPQLGQSTPEMEFKRHLRLGLEQMRRYLMDSATAELARCAQIKADDPELLFHQARLKLFSPKGESDLQEALRLLGRAVAQSPGSMKMHRLAMEIEMALSHFSEAFAHKKAIEQAYGQLGQMETETFLSFIRKEESGRELKMAPLDPRALYAPDYLELTRAFGRLAREGQYAPSEAVPVLERIMQKYPDLLMSRIEYVQKLIFEQVRVNYSDKPDVPLMSSRLVFDYAQSHLERIFDMVAPSSVIAVQTALWQSSLALKMGAYDLAVSQIDGVLGWPAVPADYRRNLMAQKGLARYRQKLYGEAIELMEASLEGSTALSTAELEKLRESATSEDIFEKGGPTTPDELGKLWTLHVVYEAAGIPAGKRAHDFPFRKGLALRPYKTAFDFEDIAPRLHINKTNGLGPSAWADYDQDGDYDLYVGGLETYGTLFRNDRTVFTDVSREAGLFHVQAGFSTTFADYDNDGWRDLYIARDGWNGPAPNSLFRNGHNGTFADATAPAGVGNTGSSFVHCWLDYDHDGFLDLYVANGITGSGDTNVLYRNNKDGTFTDVTARAGLQEPKGTRTIGVAVGDYDLDGWPDIFVSGYMTYNRLYHNKGNGTFEEVARKVRVDGADCFSTGYVSFIFDYNNDGYPDILRSSLAPWSDTLLSLSSYWNTLPAKYRDAVLKNGPKLYRNNKNGTFTEVSQAAGLGYPLGTMGAGVADLDNDGYLDIYFGTGDPKLERLEPDRFFHNNGDGTFTDLTFVTGLGNVGKGHGITFVDFDGDGDLEIYAQEGGFVHGDLWPNSFYLNKQSTGNHWVQVDLEGVKSNRDAVGAELLLSVGSTRLLREVKNSEGFGSTNPLTLTVGIGKAAKIDKLEVRWPSGSVQSFDDVPIDTRIYVLEGQRWKPVRPPAPARRVK